MKKMFFALFLSVLAALPAAASQTPQSAAEEIDASSIRIIRLSPQAEVAAPAPIPGPRPGPGLPGGINPDIIVNIGKIIMGIIEANRPVVDVKQSYAAAVPSGITHWTQLAGWSAPQTSMYLFTANNTKGGKAIEVRYQIFRTVGGNYQGKGKYLTGVTVEPISIEVSSGFKFYLEASVPPDSVANVGTSEDPIAGMVAALKWKIVAAGKETRGAKLYYLQGDGLFREIGDSSGAVQAAVSRTAQSLENMVRW